MENQDPRLETIRQAFGEFLVQPQEGQFEELRETIIAHENYSPYSDDLTRMIGADKAGEHESVFVLFREQFPNLLLSPTAHRIMNHAHTALGREKEAQMEGAIAWRCLEGILSTGDGTREKPYRILRIQDEYEVLAYRQLEFKSQSLQEEGDRRYDLIATEDGSEVVFDVTDPMRRASEKMGGGEEQEP